MVNYLKLGFIIVALVIISVMAFNFFSEESPEQQIKGQIAKFFNNASKPSGEKSTTAFFKSKAIEKLFAPRCKVDIGLSYFNGSYTPTQVSANAMRCRTMFKHVKFSAHDVEINLTSPDTARVDFTGSLSGLTKRGKSIETYKELTCNLQLIEGKWLIYAVSVREIIKK